MTESGLQKFLMREAKKLNLLAYKMVCVGKRGFPDVLVVGPDGEYHFIELKSPRGTGSLSPQQVNTIFELQKQGASVYVLKRKDQVTALLTAIARSD